jgi:recombination protein RecA
MAKKKTKKTEDNNDLFQDLAKDFKGSLLDDIGTTKYFVDTGNLALNYINSGKFIGGGIPGGKITEIFGPPASAKSLVGMSILHGAQMLGGVAVFLDCERAANRDFAVKAGHVDPKKLIVFEPPTLERTFLKINNVIKAVRNKCGPDVPIVFVYDSIGASPCEREFRETELPENYTKAQFKTIVGGNSQPGERAKVCSAEFRKLVSVLDENNATLFVINQVRNKIGVMFGSPDTTAGGGKALEYYASNRIRSAPQRWIEDKEREVPIGVNVKMQNKKCRCFSPHWETEGIQLFFDSGINPLGGLLTILKQSGRIDVKTAGNYFVKSDFAHDGVDSKTFKGSKTRNDIDPQILIDNPLLVGVETSEEVVGYLDAFGEAISLTNSEKIEEKSMTEEAVEEIEGMADFE